MRIGDIILNTWAGENNPHRYGVVVGYSSIRTNCYHSKATTKLLHSDGGFSQFFSSDDGFKVVGSIPILEQLAAFSRQNSEALESCQQLTTAKG